MSYLKETRPSKVTCTVSTPRCLDVVETTLRPSSTPSYTEQEMESLDQFLEAVSSLAKQNEPLFLKVSLLWHDSQEMFSLELKPVVTSRDSMAGSWLSAVLMRHLTHCFNRPEQS